MSRQNFEGCLVAEPFPRCIVQAGNHCIHLFLRHLVKIGSLGELSADQPIRILIRASLFGFEIEFRVQGHTGVCVVSIILFPHLVGVSMQTRAE
jgi:hypothetical protein